MSDHVSSGSDLNAPLGQLLEPISSSETRDVKPGLERKSSNLAISGASVQNVAVVHPLPESTPIVVTYSQPPPLQLVATDGLLEILGK